MNQKSTGKTCTNTIMALLTAFVMMGCSKQPSHPASSSLPPPFNAKPLLNAPGLADEQQTKDNDEQAEKDLHSSDTMEASDWLKQHPESQVGKDEEGHVLLLGPVVARFSESGAQKIVVQFTRDPQARHPMSLTTLIIVLPADPAARQKIFPLDAGFSAFCDQAPVIDRGQKYLSYSFFGSDDAF